MCLENAELAKVDFEIPVRIRKGSWDALIPNDIGLMIAAGLTVVGTAYATAAAQQLAKNDFKDASLRGIVSKSLGAIQWMIRIGKHIGSTTVKKFANTRFRNNNEEIGIANGDGAYLFVPREHLDAYASASPKLLSKLADLVEEERVLSIGIYEDGQIKEADVRRGDRRIFGSQPDDEEPDELLFPELIHGKYVELEGHTIRGNENQNNIGLRYEDRILTCVPVRGSIVEHKQALFCRCRIRGTISRADKFGNITEKKPRITFDSLIPLESTQQSLFSDS